MQKYNKIFESKKYEYIAYRDIENYRYKSVKPYREYLILTKDSEVDDDGVMTCFDNVLKYTKEVYANKKISNKMILVPIRNTCIYNNGKDGWVFEKGTIEVK